MTSLLTDFFDSVGQKLSRGPKPPLTTAEVPGSFSGYKECRWCDQQVDPAECFAMYTGVSLICEICGADVTRKEVKWEMS